MKLKFYKYNVNIEGRYHTLLIPEITEGIYYTGKYDTWYGPFIETSLKTLPYLLASFAILSEKNYIIFFDVRNNRRPSTMTGDDAQYNIVLKNNSIKISDKHLVKVLKNLKYYKRYIYKYNFNIERIKRKYSRYLKAIENIPEAKILCNNSYGHCRAGFVIYSFPRIIYARESIDMKQYFIDELIKENKLGEFYEEEFDTYYAPFRNFAYCYRRKKKHKDGRLPMNLNIGLYDIDTINHYVKGEKIRLVDRNEVCYIINDKERT